MNATDARNLTETTNEKEINAYYAIIIEAIKAECKKTPYAGYRTIVKYHDNENIVFPVVKALRENGYKVVYHDEQKEKNLLIIWE